jgi:hypothetical protein
MEDHMGIPDKPSFSWSHSRYRTFTSCARRYYYAYYLSHGGWCRDAAADVRAAYSNKKLSSLTARIGQLVHQVAADIALAIRNSQPLPEAGESLTRVRQNLNNVWRASADRDAFLRNPARYPMLVERYYREPPITSERLAALAGRVRVLLDNLFLWPGWEDLALCKADEIRMFDATEAIEWNSHPVYAAPDLLYRSPDSAFNIIDYKTGSPDIFDFVQLRTYYMYLLKRGDLKPTDEVRGRVVYLAQPEERTIPLAAADARAAEQHVRDSVWSMRRYLVDQDTVRNASVDLESYPAPPTREPCTWCAYREVCRPEDLNLKHPGPF